MAMKDAQDVYASASNTIENDMIDLGQSHAPGRGLRALDSRHTRSATSD
jgi:hypothetical protein